MRSASGVLGVGLTVSTTNGTASLEGWWLGAGPGATTTAEVDSPGGDWLVGQTRKIKLSSKNFFDCATAKAFSSAISVT